MKNFLTTIMITTMMLVSSMSFAEDIRLKYNDLDSDKSIIISKSGSNIEII